jgi:hypothetical protein
LKAVEKWGMGEEGKDKTAIEVIEQTKVLFCKIPGSAVHRWLGKKYLKVT